MCKPNYEKINTTTEAIEKLDKISEEHWRQIFVNCIFQEDENDCMDFYIPDSNNGHTSITFNFLYGEWMINDFWTSCDTDLATKIQDKILKLFNCKKANTDWLFGVIANYIRIYGIAELEVHSLNTYLGEIADETFILDKNNAHENAYYVSKYEKDIIRLTTKKLLNQNKYI